MKKYYLFQISISGVFLRDSNVCQWFHNVIIVLSQILLAYCKASSLNYPKSKSNFTQQFDK